MNEAICLVSASLMPLVVMAGIPILRPEGLNGGLGSSGMVDFEVEIQILSSVSSARAPCSGVHEKSTITIWLSVPPVTSLYP